MLPLIRKQTNIPGLSDHFFGKDLLSSFFNDGADHSIPAVNIKDKNNAFEIEVAAPGLSKEEFRIKLDKDILTISSEEKNENNEQSSTFMRKEFSFHSFKRSFSIPELVDTDKISASHKNGVLSILLPKVEKELTQKNKTIKIN